MSMAHSHDSHTAPGSIFSLLPFPNFAMGSVDHQALLAQISCTATTAQPQALLCTLLPLRTHQQQTGLHSHSGSTQSPERSERPLMVKRKLLLAQPRQSFMQMRDCQRKAQLVKCHIPFLDLDTRTHPVLDLVQQ